MSIPETTAPEAGTPTRHEQRMEEVMKALKKDRLHTTYEAAPVRSMLDQLEQLQNAEAPTEQIERLEAHIAKLRAEQGKPGDISAESPILPVILVKPTVEQKSRLELIERKILAEWAGKVMEEDEPLIKAQLREAARTSAMVDGLTQDPESVQAALRGVLVEHLLRLEGRTEAACESIDDLDPEMEFTEAENEEIRIDDTLEGAELADAILTQEQKKEAVRERKRKGLIALRRDEMEERRGVLERQKGDALIDQIAKLEVLQRALLKSRVEAQDYWLLACVRDPARTQTDHVRGMKIIKGWEPYFKTIEEVRAVRDSEDLKDFYGWLQDQRERLDYLTEGDLYALSAYSPFRELVEPLLRLRGGADPVAAIFGSGAG